MVLKNGEVPITLHKDGRIQHPPHLRTIRDGWKLFVFCAIRTNALFNTWSFFDSIGFISCLFRILGSKTLIPLA